MYPRNFDNFAETMEPGKVHVLYGARQVGKSTLIGTILSKFPKRKKYRLESGDNLLTQESLKDRTSAEILAFAEGLDLLVIDEAQRIEGIGLALKILVDNRKDLTVLVSGSSSFELAGQVGEPLTGRKKTMLLYPLSLYELRREQSAYELGRQLEDFMLYGMYPAVLNAKTVTQKKETLFELAGAYLLKDILELDRIKSSKTLLDLLRLLAWQTGSEVSLSELGQKLSLDKKTVGRYLDLLEKSFVIFQVSGFSRNLRNEITQKSKYYFYDTGIRNTLISTFNPLSNRNDTGHLWENFLMSERIKTRAYSGLSPGFSNESRFWRTWQQKEIDLIEEREGTIFAYEFKWGKTATAMPEEFGKAYPDAQYKVISRDNWADFLL
jgi:predicted AAA+ superfamily ATPase